MTNAIVSEQAGPIAGRLPIPALPSRPTPSAGGGFTGKDFLRILRKRKWMILITVIVSVAIAAVSTFLWLKFSPFYTAEAYLEVNPRQSGQVNTPTAYATREVMDRLQADAVHGAYHPDLFREVLAENDQQYNIKATDWYRTHSEDAVQELMDTIKVAAAPNSSFVRISQTGRDPKEVTLIVNAVAHKAEVLNQEFVNANANKNIRVALDEYNLMIEQLNKVHKDMQLARPGDIPMIEDQRNNLFGNASKIQDQLRELTGKVNEASAMVDQINKQDMRNSVPVQQMLENDPTLRSMKAYQVQLQTELPNQVRKFGPQHRQVKDLETKLAEATAKVNELTQEQTEKAIVSLKAMYEGNLAGLKDQQQHLAFDLGEAQAKIKDSEKSIERLRQLGDEEKSLNDRIKAQEGDLKQLRQQKNLDTPLRVKNYASTPYEPSMPKWEYMLPAGCILGLLIGLGLAFLLEMVDTSVKSSADILRRMDLPMLGMIPHTEDLEDDIADVRLAFMTNPNSLIGEAFRQIRTCLLYSGPADKRRSLLVTSPLPEDGRTTVAINLGAAMARDGRRVLVIDANFRQPAIRQLFPQVKEAGLCNVLVGQGKWQDYVCQVEANLSVLSSGPLPPNPAELLGSDAMRNLIAELGKAYDQVIFDGAPCLVVSDSAILSTLVNGTILVVRAGSNTHGIVQRMRDIFTRVGSHVLGVALNGVRATAGGYLRKSYETFYDYHEQQALPPK